MEYFHVPELEPLSCAASTSTTQRPTAKVRLERPRCRILVFDAAHRPSALLGDNEPYRAARRRAGTSDPTSSRSMPWTKRHFAIGIAAGPAPAPRAWMKKQKPPPMPPPHGSFSNDLELLAPVRVLRSRRERNLREPARIRGCPGPSVGRKRTPSSSLGRRRRHESRINAMGLRPSPIRQTPRPSCIIAGCGLTRRSLDDNYGAYKRDGPRRR